MDDPPVLSQQEWLAARKKLLAKEKEFTRHRYALNADRRRLPMTEIGKDYLFEGRDGQASLLELFEGRGQLLTYHFMFDPDWDEGCPTCSFLTDNIGHLAHLHARDTTLALVSRAPLAKIEPFRQRMGWTIPWYSSFGSDFNYDFHVTLDQDIAPGGVQLPQPGRTRPRMAGLVGRDVRPQRLPAPRRPRLPHLLRLRAQLRHPRQHLQLARPDRPRPPGRLGTAARAQRQPGAGLAPPPRPIRHLTGPARPRRLTRRAGGIAEWGNPR